MKKTISYLLYTGIVIILLSGFGCKTKEDATATPPRSTGQDVEPDQVKAQVDTRFQQKFFEAQAERALGNKDKAYNALEACLAIEPMNAAVHYELARMDADLNNYSGAISHLKVSLDGDENNPWYHKLLGDLYFDQAKWELAFKEYKEVRRLNPLDPDAVYGQVDALLSAGKLQEAIAVINEVEKTEGISPEISMQKHRIYLQLNDAERAGQELEKLAQAFPENPQYWGMCAQYYQRIGQNDKALIALEHLRQADPNDGHVHMELSEYYSGAGDDAKSFEELKLGFLSPDVSIDQKMGYLLKFYSLTDFNSAPLAQAYQLLDITEQVHPNEAKSFSIYGDFLYREKRNDEARTKYRKALELDAGRNIIWSQVLLIDTELGDFDALQKESTRAMELFPNLPQFYFYNGTANHRLKNYAEAAQSLSIGKELVVDDNALLGQFYSALGDAYHDSGKHEKSDEALEQALKINPENAIVLNNFAYYLTLRKMKLDKAAEMSKRSNELNPGRPSFMDTYAWVLYTQGNFNDALAWIENAVSHLLEPAGEVTEHYGDILFRLGRNAEALIKWKEAKALGGGSELLEQKIAEQKIVE